MESTYTATKNEQFHSIEVSFLDKPSEAVRDALKALHFRWHSVKKVWYGYADEDTTKINYTLNKFSLSCTSPWVQTRFTSDDVCGWHILHALKNGRIHDLKKNNGEWVVEIDYPFHNPNPTGEPKLVTHTEF